MLLLQAQAGGAASFFASPIFMIVLMAFRNSLSAGQQVVTSGGIYGTVKDIVNENGRELVVLEIAPSVKIKIDKSSVYADMSTNAQQK